MIFTLLYYYHLIFFNFVDIQIIMVNYCFINHLVEQSPKNCYIIYCFENYFNSFVTLLYRYLLSYFYIILRSTIFFKIIN